MALEKEYNAVWMVLFSHKLEEAGTEVLLYFSPPTAQPLFC